MIPPACATFFWSLKTELWPDVAPASASRPGRTHCLRLWPELTPVMDAITDREQLTLASYGHHTLRVPSPSGWRCSATPPIPPVPSWGRG